MPNARGSQRGNPQSTSTRGIAAGELGGIDRGQFLFQLGKHAGQPSVVS
jgi:hypothetical protein